jgi:hypothetical protein
MKKIKLVIFTVLLAVLIMSLMALSVFATTVSTFTLSSSSTQLPIMLPTGTTFNGSISTTGTVRFWVNAPNGAQIVNLGLIDKDASFSFVSQQNGNYTLNFENDLSTSIQVTLSYATKPDIFAGNNSTATPLSYLLIPIVIAVFGCILIIFFVRRKSKKQESVGYDTAPSNQYAKCWKWEN